MGGADFGGGEDGEEGGAIAGGFDVGAAALFAVDEAEDTGDDHAGFAGGFDGGDGGAAGGADVVDDDDLGAGLEEAFYLAAGAVGLFGFADEEAVDEGGGGSRGLRRRDRVRGRVRGFRCGRRGPRRWRWRCWRRGGRHPW